jgi:hypothetical protein
MDSENSAVDDNHCAPEAVPFVELNNENRYIFYSLIGPSLIGIN